MLLDNATSHRHRCRPSIPVHPVKGDYWRLEGENAIYRLHGVLPDASSYRDAAGGSEQVRYARISIDRNTFYRLPSLEAE